MISRVQLHQYSLKKHVKFHRFSCIYCTASALPNLQHHKQYGAVTNTYTNTVQYAVRGPDSVLSCRLDYPTACYACSLWSDSGAEATLLFLHELAHNFVSMVAASQDAYALAPGRLDGTARCDFAATFSRAAESRTPARLTLLSAAGTLRYPAVSRYLGRSLDRNASMPR